MIPIRKIVLTRAEGPIGECVTREAMNLREADLTLTSWSHSAPPEGGGYDKCDFVIHYQDGETYRGRYDLVHWSVETADLAKHVYAFVSLHAGVRRPFHLSDWQYADYLRRLIPEEIAAYRHFLENYEIYQEDLCPTSP